MSYENKGALVNKVTGIKSLGNCILENNSLEFSRLTSDIYRLYIQFCAEGHLAKREDYDEDERKQMCDHVIQEAVNRFFAEIVPEVVSGFYGDGEGWEVIPDATEISVRGLYADAFAIYLEGLPLAMVIYEADDFSEDEDEEPEHIEALEAVYVDEAVASQLELSEDDVMTYLEMLVSEIVKWRFCPSPEEGLYRRPTLTIVKNQEGYFSKMADIYLWGKTEDEPGYVIFN